MNVTNKHSWYNQFKWWLISTSQIHLIDQRLTSLVANKVIHKSLHCLKVNNVQIINDMTKVSNILKSTYLKHIQLLIYIHKISIINFNLLNQNIHKKCKSTNYKKNIEEVLTQKNINIQNTFNPHSRNIKKVLPIY